MAVSFVKESSGTFFMFSYYLGNVIINGEFVYYISWLCDYVVLISRFLVKVASILLYLHLFICQD